MSSSVAYITAITPFGTGEEFILPEMAELRDAGTRVLVAPRASRGEIPASRPGWVTNGCLRLPLLDFAIAKSCSAFVVRHPWKAGRVVWRVVRHAGSMRKAFKNICVLPKAFHVAKIFSRNRIQHIHAHWGGTTSTMAYAAAAAAGLPWSMTLHRWDIYENNMLAEKARTASRVRCICEKGRRAVAARIPAHLHNKLEVIHMGVQIPQVGDGAGRVSSTQRQRFRIAVPANLLPVKGHVHLLNAARILQEMEFTDFRIDLYGDGPLREELANMIERAGLSELVRIRGQIPHEALLGLYENRQVDVVVLPSVQLDSETFEGIPVSLMEAMAFGIPVIATNTGSIVELLDGGCGMLVEQRDPVAIARAIRLLCQDPQLYARIATRGRDRVRTEFNLKKIAALLKSRLFESGWTVRESRRAA